MCYKCRRTVIKRCKYLRKPQYDLTGLMRKETAYWETERRYSEYANEDATFVLIYGVRCPRN